MRHVFIVNPVAGRKNAAELVSEEVEDIFSELGESHEVYVTHAPMDAVRKVRAEAITGRALRIYACGGDGTLNECVNGAAGFKNVAITHYPCGTGNDFVKMFGEEKKRFLDLHELVYGEERSIDVINCNGRYSVNICSVGIDARIGTEVHKYSHIPVIGGVGGYIISTIVNVVKGIAIPLRITSGKAVMDGEISLVCACNGRHYGGMFNPMPSARPDDGVLEFLVVKKVSRAGFFKLVWKYAKGRYAEMGDLVTHLRGRQLMIESAERLVVNIDGERLYDSSIVFELIPGGLNFIFPQGMEFFQDGKTENGENGQNQEISPAIAL